MGQTRFIPILMAALALAYGPALGQAGGIVHVGAGSYTTALAAGDHEPPPTLYKSDNVKGPIPTNDWWTSLVATPFSEPMFAHPLALQATPAGMRVAYPGPDISANKVGIFGGMPGDGNDLTLGHSAQTTFPDARLDSFSDWFVTAAFLSGAARMHVSFGHGSPFVFARYEGGDPTVSFASTPTVWYGDASSPVLGITVNRRYYALFGPTGATWNRTERLFTCDLHGKSYFSLAVLPDPSPQTLVRFRHYAYNHVIGTAAEWVYDAKSSSVTTHFHATLHAYEGEDAGTLFALYPHQWRHAITPLLLTGPGGDGYNSICGPMKLAAGAGFTIRLTYPGVLPALPDAGSADHTMLRRLVNEEAANALGPIRDTYWEGKALGRIASVVPIAEQINDIPAKTRLLTALKLRLEEWFRATNAQGAPRSSGLFYYNRVWGTLIGYPAGYGSDTELNDHHFHYGYFLRAAAEIARHDPSWASDARWGGMIRLLQRDVASGDRSDRMFPYLRNFDPYAGHSWASGLARFADGNNQESSSEAMNAWTGMILLGETIGDHALRDLGICLYTTEMESIDNYWFDVLRQNRPKAYTPSVVTMVWGAKMVNETWFSSKPEDVHGINFMPFHGGSLYLGRYPDYVRRNYDAMVAEKRSDHWDEWPDLIWMYRALVDPKDALRLYDARATTITPEAGNAKANTYHWIHNLDALGEVDRTVTADTPLYAVFHKGATRTYVVYNMTLAPVDIRFSDGLEVTAAPRGFTLKHR